MWYEKAEKNGDIDAMNNLGYMYFTGTGVEQDYKKAFELYKKGSALYEPSSMCGLGICYATGKGTEKNEDSALFWLMESAKMGNEDAMKWLDKLKLQMSLKSFGLI